MPIGKTCFKCHKRKPLSEFYRHSEMADGHLNKCKECTKRDVRETNRRERVARAEYDRRRQQDPERRRQGYLTLKRRRRSDPKKFNVYTIVQRALRDGSLIRLPCATCGDPKTQAHHHDYSKPLDVTWLCFKHHLETHGKSLRSA